MLLSMIAVTAAIVAGLAMIDSPEKERAKKLDKRRTADLGAIALAIDRYWERHEKLPADLGELQEGIVSDVVTADPRTKKAYVYRITSPSEYELCAEFETKKSQEYWGPRFGKGRNWSHSAGRYCFKLEPYNP
jgi:hypothetical protein